MHDYGTKIKAAWLRHGNGSSWSHIATALSIGESTLREWDSKGDEEWVRACSDVIDEMRREGVGAAWRCLVNGAKGGNVRAAKELLDRVEGAVTQRQELTGANGGPVALTWWETLEAATARDKDNGNTEEPDNPPA